MSDVKIPGIGPVKKEWAYAGAAVIAGIGGYAWFARSRSMGANTASEPVAIDPDLVPSVDRVPPGSTGDSNVDVDLTGDTIKDNATWTRKATEYLASIGFEPQFIAVALGRYLDREKLSASEMDAVRAAVGAFGPPPVGGPYPIAPTLPTPNPTTPPPVTWPKPIPIPPPVVNRPPAQTPAPAPQRRYTIVKGDTLTGIARKMYGNANRWREIYNANSATIESTANRYRQGRGSDGGHWIYAGTVLVIP